MAAIFGCAGAVLEAAERDFFAATRPWGFILFKRNCETPGQVRALTAALRQAVGRPEAPAAACNGWCRHIGAAARRPRSSVSWPRQMPSPPAKPAASTPA
jgi:hypothetical protein